MNVDPIVSFFLRPSPLPSLPHLLALTFSVVPRACSSTEPELGPGSRHALLPATAGTAIPLARVARGPHRRLPRSTHPLQSPLLARARRRSAAVAKPPPSMGLRRVHRLRQPTTVARSHGGSTSLHRPPLSSLWQWRRRGAREHRTGWGESRALKTRA